MSRFDNNCLWITGGLNDRTSFPVLEAVVGRNAEVGDFRGSEFLDIDTPYGAYEFDFVQLFHDDLIV